MNISIASIKTQTKYFSPSVKNSMHLHRHTQFCKRLNWNLPSGNSQLEKDQFDDQRSHYIVVSKDKEHLGSFRLRTATDGTMVEQCFFRSLPKTVNFIDENRSNVLEITRLVSSPTINRTERHKVCELLLEALQGEISMRPRHFFVAVVSTPILRLLFYRKVRFTLYELGIIDKGPAASVILKQDAFARC